MDQHIKVGSALATTARILVLTTVFATPVLRAQSVAVDSARVESARDAFLQIPLGSPIRVLTVGNAIIEGRLAARSDTGIVIQQGRDRSSASIVRIASIWRPRRNLKSGAIAGGVTGGVLGALALGALAAGLCDRADCGGAFANGATVGVLLGAGVGGIVGVGLGALTHHWARVWP